MPSASHRFVDHTAELQLELEAATRPGVLEEATIAFGELVALDERPGAPARRRIAVTAADDPALLAAWLEELVFLVESEGLVPERVEGLELSAGRAEGVVVGAVGEPRHLVKAVTYHLLDLSFDGEAWHGRVVLDV